MDEKIVPITVSANPTKTKVWIDKNGNQIDGPNGQIIKRNESEQEWMSTSLLEDMTLATTSDAFNH